MGKKTWLKVKRGLVEDPKHRLAMGESVWLFLYMLDLADWTSGKIPEWTDRNASEQMDMPYGTLRSHRAKLESLGYITTRQRQHSQEIQVNNWSDPRSYSGETMNTKQGVENQTPSQSVEAANPSTPSDFQGANQGVSQGAENLTPTSLYIPHNHITTEVAAPPRVCEEDPPRKKPEARKVECPGCKGKVPVRNTNQGEAAICMTCRKDVLTAEKLPDEDSLDAKTGKCVEFYKHKFFERFDKKPHVSKGKDFAIMRELVSEHGKKAVQGYIVGFLAIDDAELEKAGWPISWLPGRINSLIVKQNGSRPPPQQTYPQDPEYEAFLLEKFGYNKSEANH